MSADAEDTLTAEPPSSVTLTVEPDSEQTMQGEWPVVPISTSEPQPTAIVEQARTGRSYFAFRIGSSAVVCLDAIAYVGRRPTIPRIVRGGLARLVRVASESNEVSATHLELRQSGTTVVAHDLNSTNGTKVALPGFPVRTLRPGESLVVSVGTFIDIGDRNVIEILPEQETS